MALFKLFSQIVDAEDKVFMAWNGLDAVTFNDVKDFIDSIPEDDENIDLRINCAGGDVLNGWAMYDALRQSGKNISAVIEGECSSMATCVLLAAAKENRKAYRHAKVCIHNPEAVYLDVAYPTRLTADAIDDMTEKMKSQAERLRNEQKQILDLYVERTGSDAEELQALMNEDIYINVDKAMELGFISEVLVPNTASKNKPYRANNIMAKNNVSVEENWLNRLLAKAGFKSKDEAKFNDLKFTAADGSEFEVEKEAGSPEVGDAASPDGTYTMDDGSVITITDGIIASVEEASQDVDLKDPATGESITAKKAQEMLNDLHAKVESLEADATSKQDEINALNAKVSEKDAMLSQKESEIVAAAPTDEQKEILDIVAKAGGKEWLDAVGRMQSNGAPKTPQQQGNPQEDPIGKQFLANKKKPFRFHSK